MTAALSPVSATPAQDWRNLYRTLEADGLVPSASEQLIDGTAAYFRAMVLDLAEVGAAIAAAGVQPPMVTLYCDVLLIPPRGTWLLDGSTLIVVARRIEAGTGANISLDFRNSKSATLILFADEVEGALDVLAVAEQPASFTIAAAPPSGGLQFLFDGAQAVQLPVSREQGVPMAATGPFPRALTTEFIFASLLHDVRPHLAVSMLRFVQRWSGASSAFFDVFLRSSALLAWLTATLDAEKNRAAFVPYLTQDVYTGLLTTFVEEARQYETTYRTLAAQRELTGQNAELARRLAKHQLHQSGYVAGVIHQAEANYENALSAVHVAEINFEKARRQLNDVRVDFERVGIPEWRTLKIAGALTEVAGAIAAFGGAVATSGATGGAAAATAASAVATVATAAQKGGPIAATAAKLKAAMGRLAGSGKKAGALLTLTVNLVRAARTIESANVEGIAKEELPDHDTELTATADWEIYRLTTIDTLSGPIAEGVRFASELKVAVESLAIHAQAHAAAMVGAVTAGQAYASALLQKELSKKQQQNLEAYVTALENRQAPAGEVMQQLYQRYLDAKSAMFAAFLGYRAAYAYWALQPSQVQPRIIDLVDALETGLTELTRVALDKQRALERFSPPPQPLTRKRIIVDDAAVLESFRQTKEARWNIPLDSPHFRGLDRVRLTTVRVWLEGVSAPSSQTVTVSIGTSGNYLDRLRGTRYQFIAQPLRRTFRYSVSAAGGAWADWTFENGTFGQVELDAQVDREVSYAYFQPTPFTQWEVRLDSGGGELDLSGLTSITMELWGSAMGTS